MSSDPTFPISQETKVSLNTHKSLIIASNIILFEANGPHFGCTIETLGGMVNFMTQRGWAVEHSSLVKHQTRYYCEDT